MASETRAPMIVSSKSGSSVALETLVNLCKKRGFVFQSSEIYSPMSGFYDYGPLGVELKNNINIKGPLQPLDLRDLTEAPKDIYSKIPSPATGEEGHLTPPRDFNLMFQTNVGAMSDASSVAYLRPETAQGIFVRG